MEIPGCETLQSSLLEVKSESVKVLVPQSCLTLCDFMDCSPPGSSALVKRPTGAGQLADRC